MAVHRPVLLPLQHAEDRVMTDRHQLYAMLPFAALIGLLIAGAM